MQKIACNKCGVHKLISEFCKDKNRKLGIIKTCKRCKAGLSREYYRRTNYWHTNKKSIQNKNRNNRIERIKKWVQHFQYIYGNNPICQVCNTPLEYFTSKLSKRVNFDHRHGGREPIKCNPAQWYQDRECNIQNQQVWASCDFGILCNLCNLKLPPIGREEWLLKALQYTIK